MRIVGKLKKIYITITKVFQPEPASLKISSILRFPISICIKCVKRYHWISLNDCGFGTANCEDEGDKRLGVMVGPRSDMFESQSQ